MGMEWAAFACGVGSALTWGAGDFTGGFASRRSSALNVIFFSQLVGAFLLAAMALLLGETIPPFRYLAIGGAAGIMGALGLICLYHGLATGRMGLVAPISAVVTAVLPIGFSMAMEGMPSALQAMGFGLGLLSVFLLSYGEGAGRVTASELALSFLAGGCFGLFFVFIGWVSDTAVLWPLVGARAASLVFLAVLVQMKANFRILSMADMGLMVAAGVLDMSGNTLFALAARFGRLDIAAVLASFYPATTVLLARWILKERLLRRQWMGVLCAVAALGLIAR